MEKRNNSLLETEAATTLGLDGFTLEYYRDESVRNKAQLLLKDEYIDFVEHSRFFLLGQTYRDLKQIIGWCIKKISFGTLLKDRLNNFDFEVVSRRRKEELGKLFGDPLNYKKWLRENEKYNHAKVLGNLSVFKLRPKISIITPVYNVDPRWLNKCVESVIGQLYGNWELCLYDDCSSNPETIECLKAWARKRNPKIKIGFGKENLHISIASNEAVKMASGDFIALLDNDDEISRFALYEFVKALNENPDPDMAYSDEDKIDERGKRSTPYFKPDFSPELLMSQMYVSHLSFYRKSLVDKVGGFRVGFEGSQDYDLALRISEASKNILHIPRVLYHWRTLESSTANGHECKPYTLAASVKTIESYAKRHNLTASVAHGMSSSLYRLEQEVVGTPKVTIIIPFKDQPVLLKRCVGSILAKTSYKNYEIFLVDNNSTEPETKELLGELEVLPHVSVLKYGDDFNFSAINNYAVSKARSPYVLLLNNDTEVITPDWLTSMLEYAQMEEVGAVGAKLLFENNRVQHAGVVMGLGIAGHAFKYFHDSNPGYFSRADSVCNYSAVTGACLLVSRNKYLEVGGLNEEKLGVAYNDVDFCLKLLEAGYRNVYTPYAKLYHYESISRGDDNTEDLEKVNAEKYNRIISEREYMHSKWQKYIDNDPYYSPNLTRVKEDFSLRFREDES